MKLLTLLFLALGLGCVAYASTPPTIEVALTFDDLPVHGKLPPHTTRLAVMEKILTTLKKNHQEEVYGFINASQIAGIADREEAIHLWATQQRLGNHTFTHPDLAGLTAEAFMSDVTKNEPALEKYSLTGQDWKWFRYPFLGEGDTLKKRNAVRSGLHERGYRIAEVTIDFSDWSWNSPYSRCAAKKDESAIEGLKKSYLQTAVSRLEYSEKLSKLVFGRSIPHVLLLHVGAFDSEMLNDLIATYQAAGVTFVTLEKAMADPAYATDPEFPSADAEIFLSQWMKVKKIPFPHVDKIPAHELSKTCL